MSNRLIALLGGLAIGIGTVIATGALDAEAERPAPVGAHRHFIIDSSGSKVYIGPNFCDVEASAQGFASFHRKVHVEDPGLVDVDSESCN